MSFKLLLRAVSVELTPIKGELEARVMLRQDTVRFRIAPVGLVHDQQFSDCKLCTQKRDVELKYVQ